jgi:hypothetical protein
MGTLSSLTLAIFAFTPLALTVGLLICVEWMRLRNGDLVADGPRRLLSVVVQRIPENRRDWGRAMLAEIDQFHDRSERWRFALGCAKVVLFPPATTWPRYWLSTFWRLEPQCGALSVALPPLGVPLLVCAGFAAQNFTNHDNFFNGELVPGMVGVLIISSFACMLAGVPFGIAGILRRERSRWLSLIGPVLSVAISGYVFLVQHLASKNL